MAERQATDYNVMSRVYDSGRAMPSEWVEEWRAVLTPYFADLDGHVADVGSGTGIWASFLADWFDVQVLAIEPSQGMRQTAIETRPHGRVSYVGGEAEHLPLRDGSCGALWMSTVVHHFVDLPAAAHEARRVLRDGGPVLIRQAFSGRHDQILWTRFFPAALNVAKQRHPTIESVVDIFAKVGFRCDTVERVTEIVAVDLHEYARKIETRADSCLAAISDAEFEAGLAELKRVAVRRPDEPVTAGLDLLVLR